MNPLRQDDPRHEKALEAATTRAMVARWYVSDIIATYYESLEEQGVVLVEAYAGDDAGRT